MSTGWRLGLAVFWLLALAVVLAGASAQPRVDPQTGMIRVLFMGDALMAPGFVTPIIAQDPLVRLTAVPVEFITLKYLSIEQAAASLRMYLPRTEQMLKSQYDVIIIADARMPFFPARLQNWIKSGVIDSGQGFLMAGGPQSFGGSYDHPSWEASPVGDILPCECPRDFWPLMGKPYHLVPVPGYEDHPLVRGIPWRQVWLFNQQRVQEKQGSIVVGRSDKNPPGSPILIYMDVGKGRSEAFVFDWGGNGPQLFHRWTYAPVVLSNLIYYAARVKIPEDTSLFLKLRTRLTSFFSTRSFAISVIDFAEKFGANTRKAEAALAESEELRRKVISLYVEAKYEESLDVLEEALSKAKEASDLALRAKDEAMVWVYVIEWFTVSGTMMLAGSILWALMVNGLQGGRGDEVPIVVPILVLALV